MSKTPIGLMHYRDRFHEALNNDLNTAARPCGFAGNGRQRPIVAKIVRIWHTLQRFEAVLGLGLQERLRSRSKSEGSESMVIARLCKSSERMRGLAKDFKRSDELRAGINGKPLQLAYEVKRHPGGKSMLTPKRLTRLNSSHDVSYNREVFGADPPRRCRQIPCKAL